MVEFDLRIPVANWMLRRGLVPVMEMYSLNNCDMVGFEFDGRKIVRMVAVELKLSNVSEVIRQCWRHVPKATEVWAAMPPIEPKSKEKIFLAGIGLLEVSPPDCSIVFASPVAEERNFDRWKNAFARRKEYEWRMLHPQMLKFPALKLLREANQRAEDACRA